MILSRQPRCPARRRRFIAGPVGCGLWGRQHRRRPMRTLPPVAAGGLVLGRRRRSPRPIGSTSATGSRCTSRRARCMPPRSSLPGRASWPPREDVGRHNALDKLIGALARRGACRRGRRGRPDQPGLGGDGAEEASSPERRSWSRLSAPTAHAVPPSPRAPGLTLVGLARAGGCGIYFRPDRIGGRRESDVA